MSSALGVIPGSIPSAVRPPRPERFYGTTWRSVEGAIAGYLHELRITGQGIEPTSSRRDLEITLENIGELEDRLELLRRLAQDELNRVVLSEAERAIGGEK